MNSRRLPLLMIVLVILCLIALAQPFTNKKVANANKANRSSAKKPLVEQISIESVLERDDLNIKARQRILDYQAKGRTSLPERHVEQIIRRGWHISPSTIPGTSQPRPYRVFRDGSHREANYEQVDWKDRSYQIMVPSFSTFDEPSGEVEYPPTVPTSTEFLIGKYDFYRVGIAHFLERGLRKISKPDQRIIADHMNRVFDALPRDTKKETWEIFLADGIALQAKHRSLSSEGMFQLCFGLAAENSKKRGLAKYRLFEALDQFGADDCPTRCAVFTLNQLWKFGSVRVKRDRYLQMWGAIKYWLEKDFRATPSEQRYVYEAVSSIIESAVKQRDAKRLEDFMESVEANPKLTPWLKSMLLGRYNLDVAWRYRGEGYAGSVSGENWQKFEHYSKIAHTRFEEACKHNPNFPEAAAELISISKTGHSTETAEHWFRKATEHEVGYIPAHNNLTVALLPQWGGSYEEAFDFAAKLAKESLAANAPEAACPTAIANLIEAVLKIRNSVLPDAGKWKAFFRQDGRADVVLRALDWLIDSKQEVVFLGLIREKDYWLTYKAILATEADQMHLADEAFHPLSAYNPNALYMLTGSSRSFETDRSYAHVRSSEYGPDVQELKKLMGDNYETRHKNWQRILDIAEPMSKNVRADVGGWFFRNLVDQIKQERDFRMGKEVKLRFTPDLSQWKVRDDRQVKYISPDEIDIDNRKHSSGFYMNSNFLYLSGDEEQTGRQVDFDISFAAYEELFKGEGGFHVSKDLTLALQTHVVQFDGAPESSFVVGLRRDDRKFIPKVQEEGKEPELRMGKLVFGTVWQKRERFNYFRTHLTPSANHLSVRYNSNVLEMYLNDEFICRSWSMAFKGCNGSVSFRVPSEEFTGRGVIRLSNIRVKQWAAPPLALKDKKIIKHYQDRLKADPTSRWDEFWLGHIFHRGKAFDKAIAHYEKAIKLGMRKSKVAFYIGDIHEHQGDWENAQKWYQISVQEAPKIYPEVIHYPTDRFGPMEKDSYPEDWARFRLRWHEAMTAGNNLQARKLGTPERDLRVPANQNGLLLVVESQHAAAAGDWEAAIAKLEPAVKLIGEKHRPFFKKFLASYRKKEIYVVTDEELALSLGHITFFRHFEERLPVGRKLIHRQEPKEGQSHQ